MKLVVGSIKVLNIESRCNQLKLGPPPVASHIGINWDKAENAATKLPVLKVRRKLKKRLELIMAEREGFEPRRRFSGPPKRFSKRVIAHWLRPKLMITLDSVRLALDGLGTVGS